ncbi:MAG: endopeptidase, partial [Blastocatellia bacterium]
VVVSFFAGVATDGWLRTHGPPRPAQVESTPPPSSVGTAPGSPPSNADGSPALPSTTTPAHAGTEAPLSAKLRLPIEGISVESFKGQFAERRGNRPHQAVDIMAPRGTPVHAVQNGTIAKLFVSKAGGLTVYQFDSGGRLCYYYAHLDRYANGLHDGQQVSKGDVIGYVGTSGNAPPGAPHLHFAIFELDAGRKWWQGRPLDPYLVFKNES